MPENQEEPALYSLYETILDCSAAIAILPGQPIIQA